MTWTAPTHDGWFPKLSPSGRWVAAGFLRDAFIADLESSAVYRLGKATFAGWLDEDNVVVTDGLAISRATRAQSFANRMPLLNRGATSLAADAGTWAASGNLVEQILWFNGTRQPFGGAQVDVSPQGLILIGTRDLSKSAEDLSAYGLSVYRPNGSKVRDIVLKVSAAVTRIGDDGAVSYGYSGPSWVSLADGSQHLVNVTPTEGPAQVLRWRGALWALTSGNGQCYLRPLGSSQAITLDLPATRPVARVKPDGSLVVVGNDDDGSLRMATVSPATSLADVVQPIPTWPRRFRTGVYFRARGGQIDTSVPCDCEVSANGWGDSKQGPVIAATLEDARAAGARLIALYEEGGTSWNLTSISAKHAAYPNLPIVLVFDGDAAKATWPPVPQSVKGLEAYPVSRGETPAATIARVEAKARAVLRTDPALVIVRCTYLQPGDPSWTLSQIIALQPLHDAMLARLLRDFPAASLTDLSFAWLRDTYGASAIPVLAAHVRAIAAAMPPGMLPPFAGIPQAPAKEDDVNVPGTEVPTTLPKIVKGQRWDLTVKDRNNPGYSTRFLIDEAGKLTVTLTNPKGSNPTGLPRQVL